MLGESDAPASRLLTGTGVRGRRRRLRAGRRMVFRAPLMLVVALWAIGASARPAVAHATLLQTTPSNEAVVDKAPGTVELRFS